MNKKTVLITFLFLTLIFSVGAISACDDSPILNSSNADSIQIDDSQIDSSQLNDASFSENTKNETQMSSAKSTYYKGSYDVTLKGSNSTLKNKTVNVCINDVNYTARTDDNGIAHINLNLNPGQYTANAYFAGDDDYNGSSLTSVFKVLGTVKANDVTKYYKGTSKFTATFYTSQGKFLANKNVNIKINGKTYSKKTDSKGAVNIPVNLKPGTYKIVSTDPVTGYSLTTTYRILSTISSSNINQVQGQSKKFTVKFFKSNGKALAKKYVKIKLNGKVYKIKTSSEGKATISLKKLKKGTYKAVCYNNDGLSASYKIKIFNRKASTKLATNYCVFRAGDSKNVKITFTTALNDNSNSGKTVQITLNGKTYSKKTDSKGIINFNLPSLNKGIYKVEYKYAGDKFFKSSKSVNYVTLLNDTSVTKVTLKGTKNFGYGAGTLLKAAYTADGVPLAKKKVTLNIGGEDYIRTTDYNGIVSVPVDLDLGVHTVTYQTDDDKFVNGTSGSFEINVVERNSSKVTWKCGTTFKDNSQTFKVLVTDSNGKPANGGTVEITIDGETYSSTVSSNGYATVKTDVAIGKYKVAVRFIGNNELLSSSASKSVSVQLSKFAKGINEKNTIKALSKYLKASSNCQVNNAKIKAVVKALTKGLSDKTDKAKAIFNYVRDTLDYSLYYNTHHGAVGTLKTKNGNCVDHSHLLVCMFRTAGLHARYVHGVCKFNSGKTYGHVWTQVLIGKTWVCADATSYGNSLGKINNWNTKSYSIHSKYASLPF